MPSHFVHNFLSSIESKIHLFLVPNGFQFKDHYLSSKNPNNKRNSGKSIAEIGQISSNVWHVSFCLQSLLESFSKLLSFVIQYGTFSLSYLVELCGLCYKAFNKVI